MALPTINLQITNTIYGLPNEGKFIYQYGAFRNLQNPRTDLDSQSLLPLTLSTASAEIDIDNPLLLEIETSYDNSVNLIVTDKIHPPKIINSRFYQIDSDNYKIADRKGNLDTNIYSEKNFKIETSLLKSIRTISTLDFLGITDGGKMKVGNYTFYFKLADADGNESDFISESGKVVCHIGAVNNPSAIRGGQANEDSGKIIKFRLNNLDLAYDYINVYYTRSSGDADSETVLAYKISTPFEILNNNTELSITGYETHEQISLDDINVLYSNFKSVQTLTNCQNISFAGNITNDYEIYQTLEKYSLLITPQVVLDTDGIGNLNEFYQEKYKQHGYEYYNAKNIYYKLGLWDEEIYRYGVVYIMNDYTLSPVFNIRGKKTINEFTTFKEFNCSDNISYGEDYIIEKSGDENVKGVFKIDLADSSLVQISKDTTIKPIGLKFNFQGDVIDGTINTPGLSKLTKGFFIVRQKRIPTILAQGIGIGTSSKASIPVLKGINNKYGSSINNSYFAEAFLNNKVNSITNPNGRAMLGSSLCEIIPYNVNNNALLCPEASLRKTVYNSIFNSSQFVIRKWKYNPSDPTFINHSSSFYNFTLPDLVRTDEARPLINAELTLIEPGVNSIKIGDYKFSTKAGDEMVPYKFSDPVLGDYEDLTNTNKDFNRSTSKVRGYFNSFIGTNAIVDHGNYYNIFEKDYDFKALWKEYFKVRYNDSSPYFAISDRTSWETIDREQKNTGIFFRGDCYINTFTHRMNWNFIDSDLPTNKKIIDAFTWYKHFKIKKKASSYLDDNGKLGTDLEYNKLLLLYTYKSKFIQEFNGQEEYKRNEEPEIGILEPDDKKFKKYSEINGIFGAEKINKSDVNAVGLGHWVTVKICSNTNLAMRDIDFNNPMEEAIHGSKRSFYPYRTADPDNHLPDSDIINIGISKTSSDKFHFEIPDVPFIKTNFTNRIHYSDVLINSSFQNGHRVFKANNYQDYTMEYGSLVKLVEWYGALIAVMEHGVLLIPVNERAMMTNANGENVYINTDNVLPENPKVLSNAFGSIWSDSVIKTDAFIYGIDTISKKIWRTNGTSFDCISDLKVQKFLNDNIKLRSMDRKQNIGVYCVKTHYNAAKKDVMFTFKYNASTWNLCWNELLGKWITRYTWFPEFSENINNIFYTFANQEVHQKAGNKLYKHGFAGINEELVNITHTKWYNQQEKFEFEFVVNGALGVQKVFNNLEIISNKAEPKSFDYEVVGEGYEWFLYKDIVTWINDLFLKENTLFSESLEILLNEDGTIQFPESFITPLLILYEKILTKTIEQILVIYPNFPVPNWIPFEKLSTYKLPKLPFIFKIKSNSVLDTVDWDNLDQKIVLTNDLWNGEDRVLSNQVGYNLRKHGRLKGNMQYLEDIWNVQIDSTKLQYAYLKSGKLALSTSREMRVRDKYVKIRVRYDGTQHVIINALKTLYTISYA